MTRTPRYAAKPLALTTGLLVVVLPLLGQQRLNVGGPLFTDSLSQTWAADDQGVCDGTVFTQSNNIAGTSDDLLYQTGRSGNSFSCSFAVSAPSFYYITIRLAEYIPIYTSTNPRIFNVFINGGQGRQINTSLNCAGQLAACDFTLGPFALFSTSLTIGFSSVSNPAFVNAIQITTTGISGDSTVSSLQIGDCSPVGSFSLGVCKSSTNGAVGIWNNSGTYTRVNVYASANQSSETLFNFYAWRTDLSTHRLVAQINGTGDTTGKGAFTVYDGAASPKAKAALFGHETDTAAGLALASGARIYSRSSTDLNTVPGDDTCLERASVSGEVGLWKAEACITAPGMEDYTPTGGFIGRTFVLDPAGQSRPTCNSTHRGWIWVVQGGVGVADSKTICAKDSSDVYAWTSLGGASTIPDLTFSTNNRVAGRITAGGGAGEELTGANILSIIAGSQYVNSLNGAASTPPITMTGTWFTGGSSTTTKPALLIEPTGTTSTAWSTSGTGLGVNAASGFAGKLVDLQLAGSTVFGVSSAGFMAIGTTPISPFELLIQANSGNPNFALKVGSFQKEFSLEASNGEFVIYDDQNAQFVTVYRSNLHPTIRPTGAYSWTSTVDVGAGTIDTNVNRGSAGLVQAGTTAANSSGSFKGAAYLTDTNCADSAGAAACGSAAAGAFVMDAAATTVVVSTTAVTANSEIIVFFDASLGTRLGVTCNTTVPTVYGVTARTAATSFTLTATAPVTNPACFNYLIIN